jgi:hypothetical protein
VTKVSGRSSSTRTSATMIVCAEYLKINAPGQHKK